VSTVDQRGRKGKSKGGETPNQFTSLANAPLRTRNSNLDGVQNEVYNAAAYLLAPGHLRQDSDVTLSLQQSCQLSDDVDMRLTLCRIDYQRRTLRPLRQTYKEQQLYLHFCTGLGFFCCFTQ